nr:LuxR C-terminal-related transcriptional regulator [Arthrobacter sp. zg-Y20]
MRAKEVVGWAHERLPGTGELCLLRATGPAGISRFDAAAQRIQPLRDGTAVPVLAWTGIEASILECSIAVRTGRRPLAVEHLVHALHQADELDVLRPFATAPAEVAGLLAERAGSCGAEEETAERVLALRPATARPVPFSPRQQEILSLLPSHLSLGQIASELQLSVNTVKTHVRVIYSKLGATSRHDAVTAAYQRGQLP